MLNTRNNSAVIAQPSSNLQPKLEVLLSVVNCENMRDSICSIKDLPSYSNPETQMFGNDDWNHWCCIIDEDCDWSKNKKSEMDIVHNNSIINNSRKWRITIEEKIREATSEDLSKNRMRISFTLENSSE